MNVRNVILLLIGLLLAGRSGLQSWTGFTGVEAQPVSQIITGDVARGQSIFQAGVNQAPPCVSCHQVVKGGYGLSLGPNLQEISARAASRVSGMSAATYLAESILRPQDFVVPGFHVSMYADYAQHFSDQDVADLVAYLMTL